MAKSERRGLRTALGVTTSAQCSGEAIARARAAAQEWGLPFIERARKSGLGPLLQQVADALVVFGAQGVALCDRQGSLRFSPGLAKLRIKRLEAGFDEDLLVRLGELKEGDRLLDCTLGLGADSLVAAHQVGRTGQVVGLEKSQALFALVSAGLAEYEASAGSCRIDVHHVDALDFLTRQESGSFECVLFDPMFRRPRRSSPSFDALRRFADYAPLTPEMLKQARRVARRTVLVKGPRYSNDFARLGLTPERGSPYATVAWARLPGVGGH